MFRHPLGSGAWMALLEPRHAQAVFEAVRDNRAHLRPWFPWVDLHEDPREAERFVQSQLDGWARRTEHCCGIWLDDRLVGTVGCHAISARTNSAEIGYWLAADATGRGLITRAARVMIDYLVHERGLHRITIRARVDNQKSCAVAERLGFIREGVERDGELLRGVRGDVAVYSLLAPEWIAAAP